MLVEVHELEPGLQPELRVEVRERFIHEKDARFSHDRTRERDPLPLSTRELLGSLFSSSSISRIFAVSLNGLLDRRPANFAVSSGNATFL